MREGHPGGGETSSQAEGLLRLGEANEDDLVKWMDVQLFAAADRRRDEEDQSTRTETAIKAVASTLAHHTSRLSNEIDMYMDQLVEADDSDIVVKTLVSDLNACKTKMAKVVAHISDLDEKQTNEFSELAALDRFKIRLETARRILIYIQNWSYRIRDIQSAITDLHGDESKYQQHHSSISDAAQTGITATTDSGVGRNSSIKPTADDTASAASPHLRRAAAIKLAVSSWSQLKETSVVLEMIPAFDYRIREVDRLNKGLLKFTKREVEFAIVQNCPDILEGSLEFHQRLNPSVDLVRLVHDSMNVHVLQPLWHDVWKLVTGNPNQGGSEPSMRVDTAIIKYYEEFSNKLNARLGLLQSASAAVSALSSRTHPTTTQAVNRSDTNDIGTTTGLPGTQTFTTTATVADGTLVKAQASSEILEELCFQCVQFAVQMQAKDVDSYLSEFLDTREAVQMFSSVSRAYDIATSALGESTVMKCGYDRSVWHRLCSESSLVSMNLYDGYARSLQRTLMIVVEELLPLDKPCAISQCVMEVEEASTAMSAAVDRFADAIGDCSTCILAPSLVAITDHAFQNFLNKIQRLLKVFSSTVAARVAKQRTTVSVEPSRLRSHHSHSLPLHNPNASNYAHPHATLDSALLVGCIQLVSVLTAERRRIEESLNGVWRPCLKLWCADSMYNTCLKRMIDNQGPRSIPSKESAKEALSALQAFSSSVYTPINIFAKFNDTGGQSITSVAASVDGVQPFRATAELLWNVLQQGVDLVVHNASYAICANISDYSTLDVWKSRTTGSAKEVTSAANMSVLPTTHVTEAGEALLALVPYLDECASADSRSIGLQQVVATTTANSLASAAADEPLSAFWMRRILATVEKEYLERIDAIGNLTVRGLHRLVSDVGYMCRLVETFGGEGVQLQVLKSALEKVVTAATQAKSTGGELAVDTIVEEQNMSGSSKTALPALSGSSKTAASLAAEFSSRMIL